MQIVTDSGTDCGLTAAEAKQLKVHINPLTVSLAGQTYLEGADLDVPAFYSLLDHLQDELPTTSQPSVGSFVELYRRLAPKDPEILSIHISSGLSGTVNAARSAADMVPEAQVTVVDTKTLSAAAGWQVLLAARAAASGWAKARILAALEEMSRATQSLYTLKELRYLIHGGRISHMSGLLAAVLNIKPIIGVDTARGIYEQRGQARSFQGALKTLVDGMEKLFGREVPLRVQVMHALNPQGAEQLEARITERFHVHWLPAGRISLVLGAHTGPSMVAAAFAPEALFTRFGLDV
ncbi:MAG: DegV family protein [Anaerolineales bacterium]|jgi:DegV family protein with EDD domain